MRKKIEKKLLRLISKALSEQEKNIESISINQIHELSKIVKLFNNSDEKEQQIEQGGVVILPSLEIERLGTTYEQD